MAKEYHRGQQLKVYVAPELKRAVEVRAKELGLSLSDGVREALEGWSGGVVVLGKGFPGIAEYSDSRTQKSDASCEYSHYETHELTVEPVYD
jgi:hypothetical protein